MTQTTRLAAALLLLFALPARAAGGETRSFDIQFETEDGFLLFGNLLSSGGAEDPVAILLHMYRANRRSWDPLLSTLTDAGFTVLAFDQRTHGQSVRRGRETVRVDGIPRGEFADVVRAGPKDVAAARDFLAQRGIATGRIVLIGASYGCSVALLSASAIEGVRGVILLSPGIAYFGVNVTAAAEAFDGAMLAVASEDDPPAARSARALTADRSGLTELVVFPTGGHGTHLFAPRPEVRATIADFALRAVE